MSVKSQAYPYTIPVEMYREQRQRLGHTIRKAFPDGSHVAVLQAATEVPINSTDCNYLFVQESYFLYLFGSEMPDAFGVVMADGRGILFIPRLPADFATWMGELPTPESVKKATGVEEAYYVDELPQFLTKHNVATVEVLQGINSDSGLPVKTAELPKISQLVGNAWLFHALSTQRCFKTEMEAGVLKYVCKVSSQAHVKVMQLCKPGMSQHHLESTFLHDIYYHGGCRRVSYTCICATGCHGATLHYPDNNADILDGSMALLDMGGNYKGYAADITCSFPVNGKFSDAQKTIYNAVLDGHNRVMQAMKPTKSWVDMHVLAIRTICEHLVNAGILRGTVDDLMKAEVMQFFQPHGLGHLIGIDVHDVGGYLDDCPSRPVRKDCSKLRTARILEEGLYITVEPGCYFNHALLEMAFADPKFAPMLNEKLIRDVYWQFGGVRIESDVLVTADGVINFTVVPRTVEEVERTMAGEAFSKEIEVYHNA